jgi:hypothetical protein
MLIIERNWKRTFKFYVRDVLIFTRRFIIVQLLQIFKFLHHDVDKRNFSRWFDILQKKTIFEYKFETFKFESKKSSSSRWKLYFSRIVESFFIDNLQTKSLCSTSMIQTLNSCHRIHSSKKFDQWATILKKKKTTRILNRDHLTNLSRMKKH